MLSYLLSVIFSFGLPNLLDLGLPIATGTMELSRSGQAKSVLTFCGKTGNYFVPPHFMSLFRPVN